MYYSLPDSSVHGDSPGKNTRVGCHVLFQGIFPTQGLNLRLLHCRWVLYPLGHLGNPNPTPKNPNSNRAPKDPNKRESLLKGMAQEITVKGEATVVSFKQWTKSLQERGGKVFQAGGHKMGRGGALKRTYVGVWRRAQNLTYLKQRDICC